MTQARDANRIAWSHERTIHPIPIYLTLKKIRFDLNLILSIYGTTDGIVVRIAASEHASLIRFPDR